MTTFQVTEHHGHVGFATLIRTKKHQSADRGKKDILLQASPEEIKKHQEDADRVMKEFLEEEDKDVATVTVVSQDKKQTKKTGKERRHQDAADRQDGKRRITPRSKRIRRGQRQSSVSEKHKTESVAEVTGAVVFKDKTEERGGKRRRGGSKGLRKGRRPRIRVRLKEYKTVVYRKKRMMMVTFRMSRHPSERASRRRKRRQIKV